MTTQRNHLIARIVVWAAIGILATVILVWAAGGGNIGRLLVFRLGDGDAVHVLKTVKIDNDIDRLDIEWISGGIKMFPTDDDSITVTEKASDSDKESRLIYSDKDGTLTIDCRKSVGLNFLWWSSRSTVLEISLPRADYDRISIDATSGYYDLTGLEVKELMAEITSGTMILDNTITDIIDIVLTSGKVKGTGLEAATLDIKMTSGTVDLYGTLENIHAQVTSGIATISTTVLPGQLSAGMTSGNMTISLPDEDGFSIDVNKTSGTFSSEFDMSVSGNRHTYRSGGPSYQVSCTSGNISLRKAG